MADKRNLAKRGPGHAREICPACLGRPPLVVRNGRLVPEDWETCGNRGSVNARTYRAYLAARRI